jgi:hypothetical protein
MTDPYIGSWVSRVRNLKSLTKPHLVDSTVADEPFTRCGRRLRHIEGTAFAYSFEEPVEPCRKCKP